MKLPGRKEGAVQAMRTVDPGVYRQQGNAIAGFAGEVAGAIEVADDIKNAYEVSDAQVDATNKLSRFRGEFGERESFTGEEIEALGWEVAELYEVETDANGDAHEVYRKNIPAYEVYPQALQKYWKAEAAEAAKKIERPGSRKAFGQAQERQLGRAMELERQRAVKLSTDFMEKEESAKIAESLTMGNYPGALAQINGSRFLDANEKEEARKQTGIHQEDRIYRAAASGTIKQMDEQIRYLEGKDPDRPYTKDGNMDPDMRAKYVSVLKTAKRSRESEADDYYKEKVVSEAWRGLVMEPEGGRKDWLLNATTSIGAPLIQVLKGQDLKSMMQFAEKGGPVVTDPSVWAQQEEFKRTDPNAWAQQDFAVLAGSVAAGDLRSWQKDKQEILGGEDRTAASSFDSQIKLAARSIGMKVGGAKMTKTDNRRLMEFNGLVRSKVNELEEAKGKALTGDERQQVLDDLVIHEVIQMPGTGWFGTEFSKTSKDVTIKDIPVTEINKAGEALLGYGDDFTDTNLYRMSNLLGQMRAAGVDVDNLEGAELQQAIQDHLSNRE